MKRGRRLKKRNQQSAAAGDTSPSTVCRRLSLSPAFAQRRAAVEWKPTGFALVPMGFILPARWRYFVPVTMSRIRD
jgi:hypothetical protein